MTPFELNTIGVTGVAAADLKVRTLGHPYFASKIVMLVGDIPAASSLFNHFSPRTHKLIKATLDSIEQDYIEFLHAQGHAGEGTEMENVEGEGEEGEDLSFR